MLNDMLRDRLVCGTSNNAIQRRLLRETDLTFEKALEVASSTEAADKNAKWLTDDKDRPAPIGKVNDRPSPITSPGKGHRRYKSNKVQQHPSCRIPTTLGSSVTVVGGLMNLLPAPSSNMSAIFARRRDT